MSARRPSHCSKSESLGATLILQLLLESSLREFLRNQPREGDRLSSASKPLQSQMSAIHATSSDRRSCTHLNSIARMLVLIEPCLRYLSRKFADTTEHRSTLGDGNRATRVEQIEKVGAFERRIVR